MAGAESFKPIATSNHVWFQCTINKEQFSLSIRDTMFSHSKVGPKSKNRVVNELAQLLLRLLCAQHDTI